MNQNCLLKVENLSLCLGGTKILVQLSFEVRAGEYLSIIGPNGAGKTSLLRCLLGVLSLNEGKIFLRGQPLDTFSRKKIAALVSYVPQTAPTGLPFLVEDFVALGRYPHLSFLRLPSEKDRLAVQSALEITGTAKFARRSLDTLSGGERQKVLIAAALAQETEIILLDEPTAFLDPRHRVDILQCLKQINRQKGTSILAVTHDINAAAAFSHRILALKEGKPVFIGNKTELVHSKVLSSIYETDFLLASHPEANLPVVMERGSLL